MLDNYSGTYNEADADAVATLMRDLGYAYQVAYGTGSTDRYFGEMYYTRRDIHYPIM